MSEHLLARNAPASREGHAQFLPQIEEPHDAQRTLENSWAPLELWHHHTGHAHGIAPRMLEMAEHADAFAKVNRLVGGLGALGGTFELAEGLHELQHRETQQGALDSLSGLGGILVGVAEAAGVSCPALAIATAALGAMSYGNKLGKERGYWGRDEHGDSRSAFDWAGHNTALTYHNVKARTGGGALGTILGSAAAGVAGIDYGLVAGVGNIALGVAGAAQGAGHFVSELWQ